MSASTSSEHAGRAVVLGAGELTVSQVEDVARRHRSVILSDRARDRINASHDRLQHALSRKVPLYGVNTGFGSLSLKRISDDQLRDVQRNLLRSHAAGVGPALPEETVRAMLLLLAASLARGHSGVRPIVPEQILNLLNHKVTPVVPETGSVGASGDLAPLAHAALVLMGEGRAVLNGQELDGGEALRKVGLKPIEPAAKEGLALINGTHLMAAQASLIAADMGRVIEAAVCACAMSMDGCMATDSFLDERVYGARNHDGPRRVAARLRQLLHHSEIVESHRTNDPRVQDPYSLRCAPYVLGAALQLIDDVRNRIDREINAVTDNPLVLEPTEELPETVVSAGNFHGMPIALPLDTVALAFAHIAGIAERRIYHLMAASDQPNPLNAHLSPNPGLHSGLMITQYTAAACCNELITLCTPSSVSNIPTCAGMEDYNSFGPRAAAKARRALELCAQVIAIEFLCAAEALEYHRPRRSGAGVERAHQIIREHVKPLTGDRSPAADIESIVRLILAGRLC